MSSNAYSAVIHPDAALRRLVLGVGVGLAVGGLVLITMLPVGAALRAATALLWCVATSRELFVLYRAWQDCRAMRFTADGDVTVLGTDGEWRTGELVPGSILLPRVGWIRLRVARGPRFAELLRGERRRDVNWRRLHVIWRHFGDPA